MDYATALRSSPKSTLLRVIDPAKKKKPRKRDEENLHIQCVEWFDLQYPKFKKCLIHPANGGSRSAKFNPKTGVRYSNEAKRLRKMGVRAGVLDLLLLLRRKGFGGLWIEMKSEKGVWSDEQLEFRELMIEQGYYVDECRSLEGFMRLIKNYIS